VADPLTVCCPHCGSRMGVRCGTVSGWSRKPHAARVKAAEALAAYQEASNEIHYAVTGYEDSTSFNSSI